MKSIRELIEMIANVDSSINEASDDVSGSALPVADSISGPLQGTLDMRAVAAMLPEVNDAAKFASALQKVRLGRLERLTRWEKEQLSAAFISLLRADQNSTNAAMQKLRAIHSQEGD